MGSVTAIVTAISVIGNVVLSVIGLWQKAKSKDMGGKLEVVKEGLRIVESAVEQNKGLIEETDVGKKVTDTIKTYGAAARTVVDVARNLSRGS